ncbi:hypothetical protein D3C75_1013670 [compost metagenome]
MHHQLEEGAGLFLHQLKIFIRGLRRIPDVAVLALQGPGDDPARVRNGLRRQTAPAQLAGKAHHQRHNSIQRMGRRALHPQLVHLVVVLQIVHNI